MAASLECNTLMAASLECAFLVYLGSASERAKGCGAVWAKPGHSAQYYYDMLLARFGMGDGERANTSAGSRA